MADETIPLKPNGAYPSLPQVGADAASHTVVLKEIKEAVEQHERRRGDPLDSFVRLRELIDVGVLAQLGRVVVRADDTTFGGSVETEFVQDTIGDILVDSSEIDFTYNDAIPSISASLKATLPEAHTFSGLNVFSNATTAIQLASVAPRLLINETDADPDEKYWSIDASAGVLRFRAWNDLLNASETFFDIVRTGTNIDGFTFSADVLAFNGYSIFHGAMEFQDSTPRMLFVQTTGAADNKVWRSGVTNESFRISAVNDIDSVTTNAVLIDRTGTTIDLIELNGTLLDFNGLVALEASAIGSATFRIPHGAAPTAPVDGDTWTTTAGLFVRINGVTVGPLAAGGGSGGGGYPPQLGFAGI